MLNSKKYSTVYNNLYKSIKSGNGKTPMVKICQKIPKKSTVLEFGPASGYMTKYLKEELNCNVSCIEIDKKCAKEASKYSEQMIVCDIETTNWEEQLKIKKFDAIIFADVLEHLKNPWVILKKAENLLKSNGKIFISIPNIGHNSILIDLWNNKFKYRPLGLLDNTHLRFFGLNNLEDLLKETNLKRIETDAFYRKEKKTFIKNKLSNVSIFLRLFFLFRPYGRVFQIIMTVQKKKFIKEKDIKHKFLIKKFRSK